MTLQPLETIKSTHRRHLREGHREHKPCSRTTGNAGLQSLLLLATLSLLAIGSFSAFGHSSSRTIQGVAQSAANTSSFPPSVAGNSQAGVSSVVTDAARLARELAEVTDKLDNTWRTVVQLREKAPYTFELKEYGDTGMARMGSAFDEQLSGAQRYAQTIIADDATFEERIAAQRAYWELTDDVSDKHHALIQQTKSGAFDVTLVRNGIIERLRRSKALRKRLLDPDLLEDLDTMPRGSRFLELISSKVRRKGEQIKIEEHPKFAPEFEEHRLVVAAIEHKLGAQELDPEQVAQGLKRASARIMDESSLAKLNEAEDALRVLVGRYDEIQGELSRARLAEGFNGVVRGYDLSTQDKLWRKVILPRLESEFASSLGVTPDQAFILHGPPGTGKTFLAKRLAELLSSEDHVRFIQGAQMNSKYVGEAEEKMRKLFDEAIKKGTSEDPFVIIFDELDGVIPNDPNSGGSQARRSAFLSGLDRALKENPNILVFGATNNLQSLDIALRRPGRFGEEVFVGAPSLQGRLDVLSKLFEELHHDLDINRVANYLEGLTFADIEAVLASAKQSVLESSSRAKKLHPLRMNDIVAARKDYIPTMLRENDFQIKPVSWDQIAGVDHIIERLREDVVLPLAHPELFEDVGGVARPKSVLLHGPPGTGKTLLAAALASDADVNIITALASNLRTPGQVAELFERARNAKPAIIFIDELEAVAKKRGHGGIDAVVNQLLTEMDGLGDGADNIVVIGTTNFKDSIDEAILRPGRLESHVYVGLPDEASRRAVLDVHTKKLRLAKGNTTAPDLDEFARKTEGYTPADLKALTEGAVLEAAKRRSKSINRQDFERALRRSKPSLTPEQVERFGELRKPRKRNPVGFAVPID